MSIPQSQAGNVQSEMDVRPEPCLFPRFDTSEQESRGLLSIEGHLVDRKTLPKGPMVDVLCAAWALVLATFTGQETVCFGFCNDRGRMRADTDHPFQVRQLAQLHVIGSQRLQDVVTAYSLHAMPRTDSATFFNTAVTLSDLSSDGRDTATCGHDVQLPTCQIHIKVDPATLQTIFSWDGAFMTREQAHSVKGTYAKIVTQLVNHPDLTTSELNFFSEQNLQQVEVWNESPLSDIRDCIHHVIARQADARPEAEAVCSWDGSFSYKDLLSLSSRLASRLVACGITKETFVPICFDKSKWTIVAMLAVLKAGGIFVPLDPTHPVPRLQALVHKVGAHLVLCSPNHVGTLETLAHTLIPVDDHLFSDLPHKSEEVNNLSHTNGAYMIFTSGTTGEPKGALIEHGALLSSALAHGPAMMMDRSTRSLQFAASTFDVSITEILTCLILGGCVCVPSEEARLNAIEDAITQLRVNWALLTPTFVKFIDPHRVPTLKTLVTGGEAMNLAIIRSWSHINLINCYGPAETSVVSHVHRGMTEAKSPLNIGEQVGIHCWVVDRYNHDRLMPVGAVGELVIEGHTMAREYYKEPERTKEAFIVDPLWIKDQAPAAGPRRMYKTGDLVRYNADGTFHIAGRKDTQIKYHGQRIELGEIEHHLNANPSVKHAMVALPKEGLCKGRLLTVLQLSTALDEDLVPKGRPYHLIDGDLEATARSTVEEVKDMLSKRLPPYMVPSMWIAVEFIPRLQSGKLDRKQTAQWLNTMDEQLYRQLNPVVAAEATNDLAFANPTESTLHEIWSHVLNLKPEQLSLGQSFLSVGGDSISAMQVMAECKKKGLGLTVRHIIGTKSISDLALHVKDIEMPLFHKEVLEQPFELSPIQKLYFSRPDYDRGHYNQSFLLRTSRRILPSELHAAIGAVVNRHSMLRARFSRNSEGLWQQRITSEVQSSYRIRTVQLAANDEVEQSMVDSQTCLNATDGPLFAADLIDVDGKEQLLFAVAHHLVIDLVSWRVILQEIEEVLLQPDSLAEAERPLPFQIWCNMQSEHAASMTPEQALPIANMPDGDLGYWGMQDEPNVYGEMIQEGFQLDESLTSLLMTECNDSLRTDIPDILLAAMISSFSQTFTDRRVPAIFAEGHGREVWDPAIDLSTVVGWFTTIYPVFSEVSSNATLVEAVKLVKDSRRKVPANGRPYFASRWLTQQGSEAFSRHWPLEITFNYLGKYQQLERAGGLFTPVGDIAGEVRSATKGADVGPDTSCISLFEVSAVILKGSLRFSFLFNRNIKHLDKVQSWIELCRQNLSAMVQELSGRASEASLSDFPLLDLSYDGLDTMIKEKLPAAGVSSLDLVEDIYPCSPMQAGLLVSTAKDDNFYAAYALHEVKSRSTEAIDTDRLASAWATLVQYHSILRTVFIESTSQQDALFDQVVLKEVEDAVVFSDIPSEDDARQVLDAPTPHSKGGKQALYRFEICRTQNGKVFCKLDISHTIMDGTSMSIIFRDLARAYEGTLNTGMPPLYGNYISYITQQPIGPGLEYWSQYLSGIEPCHFPLLDDAEAVESKELRYIRVHFEELAELQALCDKRGVTIVNAIYAAWALTLRLYTASEGVCFGYLTSSRDLPIESIRDVVGPVINMVVCHLQVLAGSTLGELMETVQKDYLNSLEYRHVPLAEVQHALQLSNTALFNTALSYRKLPQPEECLPDILFEECRPTYDPDEYNVSINIEAGEKDMAIDLMYWTDTLSDRQANNVASSFTQALRNILHSCDTPVAQLNHLGEANHSQIRDWNHKIPEAIESCVHDLVGEQIAHRPDAPAIAAWDLNISYRELDQLSKALAHHIANLGVSLEVPVLICFEKSGLAVVTMLAILRAGGICVPLDPGHPDTALKLRADDTKAPLALVSPSQVERFKSITSRAIAVDHDLMSSLSTVDGESLPNIQPSNACFIIYTSGSTGRPKGVVLEHRGIATNAAYTGPLLGYHQDARVLQFASHTFDNSLAEIFTTLVAGGCVCVPSEHERLNDLAGVMDRLQVTLADITPTVACFLQPTEVPSLKTLALGGEAITAKCVNLWKDFVSLQCCYGPSECSVNSTYSGKIAQPGQATNIGQAVGSVCWVVDQNNIDCLLPIGCVGELLVDGPIVSRGYLNLPERTKESFIKPPRWSEAMIPNGSPGRRLYKTGDLVRYNSDGMLMYLGRKDTQVKLNGQRIELGEIERNIENQLPEGSQIAVELVSVGIKKALACFICTDVDNPIPKSTRQSDILPMSDSFGSQAKSLEIALGTQIPAYMVPSIWIPISEMPLSSAGKLNRRSLRLQAESVPAHLLSDYMLATKSGRAPESDVEKMIATFWTSILGLEVSTIGVEDNFFKLGGDSLGAMRLVTMARNSNLALTVASIFQEPTLLDMANSARLSCTSSVSTSSTGSLVKGAGSIEALKRELAAEAKVSAHKIEDVYPCTSMQEGLMALSNKETGAYVAQLVYHLPSGLDPARFTNAWGAVTKAEPVLRTRIVHTEKFGFLQAVVDDQIDWTLVDNLAGLGKSDRLLPRHNGAPLTNYALVGANTEAPYFVWSIHHALYDGWCLPIILDKVKRCYTAEQVAKPLSGPSYKSFIRYITGVESTESEVFWKSHLQGLSTRPFPRLPSPSYQASASSLMIHHAHLKRHTGTEITLATRIRAAWALTNALYSETEDVVFWETLTGRDAPVSGIEDMVGATLATIPVRVTLEPSLSVQDLLMKVQKHSAAMTAHQYLGIQQIKKLSNETASACSAQNLIAINHGPRESADSFWNEKTNEMAGTNFYTYPLMLSLHINEQELESVVHFDCGVVAEWQVRRIMDQFAAILDTFTSSQALQMRLDDLNVLSPTDTESLRRWTQSSPPLIDGLVYSMIKTRGEEKGTDKVAICSWDGEITHQTLDTLSSRLAGALAERGIGAGTFVPFCLHKSHLAAVSMLAILKCGAAFVPLDPSHPDTRLGMILEDIDATVVLCSPSQSERFTQLGKDPMPLTKDSVDALALSRALPMGLPENPAYVIFTSGTTGKPKGTIVSHRAFCSGAVAHGLAMGINAHSRVLQFASYTFDASIMEVLTTLIHGGTVCIPSDEERLNDITGAINRLNVNWALLTPSVAQLILPSMVPSLETLVLGGEAMSAALLATWSLPSVRLMNAYGPSETSVVAAVNSNVTFDSGPTNIGRPVGSVCWVVDSSNHGKLVPVGALGELVVEGPILADGYLKNPDKTSESFITNPKWCTQFSDHSTSGQRKMYKTGDLVKLAEDGSIIFHGRKDDQVKINGQRLELSEVEYHITTDPSVQHGLVTVPASGPLSKQLTAIISLKALGNVNSETNRGSINIVEKQSGAFHLTGLRERVASHLAAYMIPSRWIVIENFPLQPSGKLDRRQVLNWVVGLSEEIHDAVLSIEENIIGLNREPSDLEIQLRSAWAKVLNLKDEKIPYNQSFLHLGGDSISAMKLMAVCRSSNLALNVGQIMQSSSIVDLAQHVTLVEDVVYDVEIEEQPFELSPIQKVYFDCMGTKSTHFNQSLLVGTTRTIAVHELSVALHKIVQSHSMLRSRFFQEDGVWFQRIATDVDGSLRVRSHLHVDNSQASVLMHESQKSLDISAGPLIAADLFDTDASGDQMMLIVAHHLVVDVVSWQIILHDLEQLLLSPDTCRLTKSLPFQTWTRAQAAEARRSTPSEVFHDIPPPHANLAYWGMEDKPNPHAESIVEMMSLDTSQSILLLGPCHESLGTDVPDVLLACLLDSFRKSFPDRLSAPAIFNEGHGRETWDKSMDLSRTVGWFTTLCPIYLPELAFGDTDIVDVVRWVKDFRRRAPSNGRPYFAHSVYNQQTRGDFDDWPLEIAFNYLGKTQDGNADGSIFKTLDGGLLDVASSQFDVGDEVPRLALIEITATVTSGALNFSFSFNRHMNKQGSIRQWVNNLRATLTGAAESLCAASVQRTLSDFPMLPLSYGGMADFKRRLSHAGNLSVDDVEDAYPCSPVQQGIIITQMKSPDRYSYSITFEVNTQLPGDTVDVHRLAIAWQATVKRHSTLRTIFLGGLNQEDSIDQVVMRSICPNIATMECNEDELHTATSGQTSLGFPENQPPHRFRVFQTPNRRVVCVLEMSHAIADGTSMPILFRDLSLAYDGVLPASPVSAYRQFVAHTRRTPDCAATSFWKEYLSGVEPCHFPTFAGTDTKPILHSVDQPLSSVRELHEFCMASGVTLSNLLQLTWALVLQAYTGLDDVCFGYLASSRDVPVDNIDEAIGVFISMLVFRVQLDPSASVIDTLSRVNTDLIQAMQHKGLSLAQIQHEVSTSNTALFNTAYSFQRRSVSKSMSTGTLSFNVREAQDPSEYDITVNVEVWDSNAELQLCYWTDKIPDTMAKNISSTFDQILTSIVSGRSTTPIGKLTLVSEHCTQQISSWNKAEPEYIAKCVHHIFEQNASQLVSDAQAIHAWDSSFTYKQLDEASWRLAQHLTSLGVGPNTYVPLCFEKSAWTVVAMLAVLKSGGAFVPLDPAHPPERIRFLLHSVQAKVALCSPTLTDRVQVEGVALVVISEDTVLELQDQKVNPVPKRVTPEDAAYIIFTSGTTGLPKGTIVNHGAFSTGGIAHSKAIKMELGSRVLQFASHTFDASIMEILTTLLIGGCICIPNDHDRLNDLPGVISRFYVNWALLTPSVANVLKPGSVPSLKVLVTGGEAMSRDHITKWSKHCALINAYGPSETSVIATASLKVDGNGTTHDTQPSTIGRAVGSRSWIADPRDHNRLMPIGSIGELIVEGPIVAKGYLQNETKTRDAFIDHPSWRQKMALTGDRSDKMYKTGDLVAYNPDGSIRYMTRKDTQIKLNGQRIELGEIEHHVNQNLSSEIQSAVELVITKTSASLETKSLAVFLTSDTHAEVSTDEMIVPMNDHLIGLCRNLKSALKDVLPAYMVPTIYVPLASMPWTAAGKLDRHKLKAIVQSLSPQTVGTLKLTGALRQAKPMTPVQMKLQRAWRKVLGHESETITSEDSFFRLGGDSLGAMKLVSAAKMEDIVLSVMDIFKHPKLSEMAARSRPSLQYAVSTIPSFSLLGRPESSEALLAELAERCGVSSNDIQDAYPCSALQEGLVTSSLQTPGAYVARNVFELPRTINVERFKLAWQRTIDHVDILRARIVNSSSFKSYQVVLRSTEIKWGFSSNLQVTSEESRSVPGTNGGPLSLYTIVEDGLSDRLYFAWTVHHALYDAWSMPSILRLASEYYMNSISTDDFRHTPYVNFINYLEEVDTTLSDNFWRAKLGSASVSHFPPVPPLLASEHESGATLTHIINYNPAGLKLDTTVASVIRAAWALVLGSQTGSDDVIFGETLSGRDIGLPGIEEVLGPTLTTVPQCVHIDRDVTVADFINKLHQSYVEMIPHQHAGLQKIRRLGDSTALVCDFRNLLVIQAAEGTSVDTQLMTLMDDNVDSENFFTYPLVVECAIEPQSLKLSIHHDTNILSGWQAKQIAHHFDAIIQQLYSTESNSTAKVSELSHSSPEDIQLLRGWNGEPQPHVEENIASSLREVALRQPDTTAIQSWDGELKYSQLLRHAERLAKILRLKGVKAEKFVPCCLDKSLWSTVSMVAVILAGGALVPLDPMHPPARHADIVRDCDASILLCSPQHEERFKDDSVEKIVITDALFLKNLSEISMQPSPLPLPGSRDAAFVIYTSGSTGKPKGVVIEHRSLCSSSKAWMSRMKLTPTSRVFHFTSYAFDIAMGEIFGAFTMGACLCVPSEEMRTCDLPGAMNTLRATWAFLTPSVANIQEPKLFKTLTTLVCGGEALTPETIEKWADKVELMNGYGPAECTIFCVANSNVSKEKDHTRIGSAMTGGRAWVVDPRNHDFLVPLGCVGELLIDGPIVTRGYLKQDSKTKEVFIDNPAWAHLFSNESLRLYKTGDLVRYCPDGSLTFVGRRDHQVKLHGQRMELGEIEAKLEMDPLIRHAHVSLPKKGICKGRIVAVLSLDGFVSETPSMAKLELKTLTPSQLEATRPTIVSIQTRIQEVLPAYMIPSTWLVVESLPFLVSGKLDRAGVLSWLAVMDGSTLHDALSLNPVDEPTGNISPNEKLLRRVVSSVLNLREEETPVTLSFISLGGDSITAMQVMTRCRDEGFSLTLQEIIRSRSIKKLSETMKEATKTGDTIQEKEPLDQYFALSPIQQLFFNNSGSSQEGDRFNQSQLLKFNRRVDPEDFQRAVHKLVDHHSMLRSRFGRSSDGQWRQLISADILGSYKTTIHKLNKETDLSDLIAMGQAEISVKGPLFVAELVEQEDGPQILSLIAHHLVVDIVSWITIIQDLETLLEAPSAILAKSLSFQAWNKAQAEHFNSLNEHNDTAPSFEVRPADLDFWNMSQTTNVYGDMAQQSFVACEEVTVALAQGGGFSALSTEPLDLFISSLLQSFALVFEERELPTVFNESHGRETWDDAINIAQTVGWFTALTPVQISLSNPEDSIETVRKVKDTRRSLSNHGIQCYGQQYLNESKTQEPHQHKPMEVLINFLGRTQQNHRSASLLEPFEYDASMEDAAAVSDVGADTHRLGLFEISVSLHEDGIHFTFMYNKRMGHQERISQWVSKCHEILIQTAHLLRDTQLAPTLSDLPLLPINDLELQSLVERVLPAAQINNYAQVEDIYPCSPIQTGMLLSQAQDPARYIFHTVVEVLSQNAEIDAQKLSKACGQVIDRHASLRTVFINSVYSGGTFDQVVLKTLNHRISIVKCKEIQVMAKLNSTSLGRANEGSGPKLPYQITICHTPQQRVFMKLEMNHAVTDGASTSLILKEVGKAYEDSLEFSEAPSYKNYINYITKKSLDTSLKFWITYLAGATPTIFPSLAPCYDERRLQSRTIDFGRWSSLHKLAVDAGVTLPTIVLASWALLLRRYTNSDDVSFGFLVSGRDAPVEGVDEIVGPLINMLVFRFQFSSGMLLKTLFYEAQEDYLTSLAHQHVPLANVSHALGHKNRQFFNTAVSVQNGGPSREAEVEPLQYEPIEAHDPSEFSVTLNVSTAREDEGVLLRYWSDVLSDEGAEELATRMTELLDDFVDHADEALSHLRLFHNWQLPVNIPSTPETVQSWSSQDKERSRRAITSSIPTSESSFDPDSMTNSISKKMANSAHLKTSLSTKLKSLWSETLGVENSLISHETGFFDLGGDSIIAMSMASNARELGLPLNVTDVFKNPTFGEMLACVWESSMPDFELLSHTDDEMELLKKDPFGVAEAPYEPFSMLSSDEVESFIRDVVCPATRVSRATILDVLPATDFQSQAIEGHLLESRWMLNHFYLDGEGPVDTELLQESLMNVVASFDILRTVFVRHQHVYWQVVLRQIAVNLSVCFTDDLEKFTAELSENHKKEVPQLGRPLTRFTIARHSSSKRHRIFIRISHAQYDGICFPAILDALKASYEGRPISTAPSFGSFISKSMSRRNADQHDYWTRLLDGSTVTDVVARDRTTLDVLPTKVLKRTVDMQSLASLNITTATIVKTAWSIALAKITGRHDLVFGHLVNGRNVDSVAQIGSIVGPCLNVVPVRVQINKAGTALELLRTVQDQQVESMPHESLGFREIIEKCTDWQGYAGLRGFSTTVQHQSMTQTQELTIGGNAYGVGALAPDVDSADFSVVTTPVGETSIEVCLVYADDGVISEGTSVSMFNTLCGKIQDISKDPTVVLGFD